MPPSKSHYEALDGLRGTAALCVLTFHFWEVIAPDWAHNPMRHAFLAVDFFFALSGFVIGHAYDGRLGPRARAHEALTLSGFFRRRLIRLHPMALAGLAIGTAAWLLDPFVGDSQQIGVKIPLVTLLGAFALSLLLLPTPNVPNSWGETHSLNGPSWTLFQEYIANVLYGCFGHKLGRGLHVVLCVASAVLLLWTGYHFSDLSHGWDWANLWAAPVRLACPFLLGLLVYRTGFRLAVPQPFVLLSLVLVAIFMAPPLGRYNGVLEAVCVIIVFPLVLAAGAGVTRVGGAVGALCRFVGELSYPVYIIHYGFVYVFAHWNWSTHPTALRLGLAAAGTQVGIVMLAYALLRWYDRPVRAWLARTCLEPAGVLAAAPARQEARPL
jgi:peptidoglycan/LPS O-acetylase OafA/YrhL